LHPAIAEAGRDTGAGNVRKTRLGALSPPTFQELRYPKQFSSKEQKGDDRDYRPIDDAYCEKHRRIIAAHEKTPPGMRVGPASSAIIAAWPRILDEPAATSNSDRDRCSRKWMPRAIHNPAKGNSAASETIE
jgi:hypothetical protein